MADLQDTTELISQLTSKLTELDNKVSAYRLDMAEQFSRHSDEVLSNVPADVAHRVLQAISESLHNFPSLYPPGSLSSSPLPTPTSLEEKLPCGRGSPPPILPHTSGSPKEPTTPTSHTHGSHEREQELRGYFVPTFLPLLEKVERRLYSPQTPSTPTPASPGPAPNSSDPCSPGGVSIESPLSPRAVLGSESAQHGRRPGPLRRATNASIDSIASDSSVGRTRKSALRRPSSASSRPPDSPRDFRRVRFDFEGQEVLPSSSPETVSSPHTESEDTPTQSEIVEIPYITSLGDIEGDEDESLPGLPKKVSSTQALRALSKAPLDEGTIWTIVNTESASETSLNPDADKVRRNTATNSSPHLDTQQDSMDSNKIFGLPQGVAGGQARSIENDEVGPSQPRTIKGREEVEEEDEDSDDDGNALFMMSRKGGPKPPLPVSSKSALGKNVTPSTQHATTTAPSMPIQASLNNSGMAPAAIPIASSVPLQTTTLAQVTATTTDDVAGSSNTKVKTTVRSKKGGSAAHTEDDDEDFFDFDDDDHSVTVKHAAVGSKSSKKYLPETNSDDDDSDNDVNPAECLAEKTEALAHDLARSPPIETGQGRTIAPERKVPENVSRKPAGTRPMSTSIGTYDGKPVTPHVVRDKALRDELKNQDRDVPFFVGSVNGNSGVDASNIKSYQASVMSPATASGVFASGSFAERLMWERSQGFVYDSDGEGRKGDKGGSKDDKVEKAGGG